MREARLLDQLHGSLYSDHDNTRDWRFAWFGDRQVIAFDKYGEVMSIWEIPGPPPGYSDAIRFVNKLIHGE
jgi:hypothetical protein